MTACFVTGKGWFGFMLIASMFVNEVVPMLLHSAKINLMETEGLKFQS